MILCGFGSVERIMCHEVNALDVQHYIDLTMDKDEPVFYVTCCCDDRWQWDFDYSKTNYERIKNIILDCMFKCGCMEELIEVLDEIFEEIVYGSDEEIEDDEINIDNGNDDNGCCGNCGRCRKYSN